MYAFLEGIVEDKSAGEIVINVGGIGFQALCSTNTMTQAPARGESMRLYTVLIVRQDAQELFGFASKEERAMFLKLTTVSGIGPRTGINVLSAMPLHELTLAIMTEDLASLSRAPGIGKMTAQRISLELKDKLGATDLAPGDWGIEAASPDNTIGGVVSEAILALQSLGYTPSEASRAVNQARKQLPDASADGLVKAALKGMLKG